MATGHAALTLAKGGHTHFTQHFRLEMIAEALKVAKATSATEEGKLALKIIKNPGAYEKEFREAAVGDATITVDPENKGDLTTEQITALRAVIAKNFTTHAKAETLKSGG